MRLLCKIGIHKAAPGARWNAGHCFGQCRRCGKDLVRTAQGRWKVPKGYRIVWKTRDEADVTAETPLPLTPPPFAYAAAPATPAPAAADYAPAASPAAEPPIAAKPAAPAPAVKPPKPPPISATLKPLETDFMGDADDLAPVDTDGKEKVRQACTRALTWDFLDEDAPMISQRPPHQAGEPGSDEAAFDELANVNGALR